MIDRLEILASRIRRMVSRNRWSARLLGHPPAVGHGDEPGLILIQVDGLGADVLRRTLDEGRMPFLARLIEDEGYDFRPLYSGMPSSTPGFQAELYYGIPTAIPAFGYRDSELGRVLSMNDPSAAAAIEARLAERAPGLLRGGSAWSTIFSGGAAESHLCAATAGVDSLLRALAPTRLIGLIVWHGWSVLRVVANLLAETALALWDMARGSLAGRNLFQELRFVPLRVAVTAIMREMVVAGASIDAERGLPVVALNLLAYDEHSHRRGPDSRFARWTLRGIDRSIRRVWLAAHRSRQRDYQIWIFSDHGQERTLPYPVRYGEDLSRVVLRTYRAFREVTVAGQIGVASSEASGQVTPAGALDRAHRPDASDPGTRPVGLDSVAGGGTDAPALRSDSHASGTSPGAQASDTHRPGRLPAPRRVRRMGRRGRESLGRWLRRREAPRAIPRAWVPERSRWLGQDLPDWVPAERLRRPIPRPHAPASAEDPWIVHQGPVGFVYLPADLDGPDLVRFAEALCLDAHVPLVLARDGDGGARVWTQEGRALRLPAEAAEIFGPDHPHLARVTEDTLRVVGHADAGTLVLMGWDREKPMSLQFENGAHGGPGPRETTGSLILPPEMIPSIAGREPLRPLELRRLALQVLEGNGAHLNLPRPRVTLKGEGARAVDPAEMRLRLLTYNVHGCRGMDGKYSTQRISRVIARIRPDIICLQELDQSRNRSGGIDQVGEIAAHLQADYHFHAVSNVDDGRFGNAILSAYPLTLLSSGPLPRGESLLNLEDRGVLWVGVETPCGKIQVFNTHLSIREKERRIQAAALVGPRWLRNPGVHGPVLLAGDLNASSDSWSARRIGRVLWDVNDRRNGEPVLQTWSSRLPIRRIDHVFVSNDFSVQRIRVPRTRLSRVASDHLPLVVDVACGPCASRAGKESVAPRKEERPTELAGSSKTEPDLPS
jgi:endonuclease/exonuclease/phosphatase family metal-dependent hydrolase